MNWGAHRYQYAGGFASSSIGDSRYAEVGGSDGHEFTNIPPSSQGVTDQEATGLDEWCVCHDGNCLLYMTGG